MSESRSMVEIFSDGACSGNPGPGGFGTLLRCGERVRELSGFDPETTNNRMELLGAIAGLEALTRPCRVRLTTDSQYVCKGMTEWIHGWQKKGWKNSKKEDVANRDLWERLLVLVSKHEVSWHWVRGHAGHAENERCDELARQAIADGCSSVV
ncbi:ribonuclease HI [Syntrophotalea carbinolica DSM 2380]|uniref:Ribonuclease H n=1 Tax=Syntrophotalea carbinolica (strain DSM 2380 / NBRC 103641 / GraBd1) TaxID=338963 RepID=RNH_SYNC1|nr:ribonuclease HI [Syntrophotalea carbinolica]Q3A827.1 RecName: Full=Ribonuclease H; Short=RNase H [Syntrophotalea carbinolica DSM 2380]ABA87465.1 ribonuclease HI [Syntrophotalea carbinolica DSM 2380]